MYTSSFVTSLLAHNVMVQVVGSIMWLTHFHSLYSILQRKSLMYGHWSPTEVNTNKKSHNTNIKATTQINTYNTNKKRATQKKTK